MFEQNLCKSKTTVVEIQFPGPGKQVLCSCTGSCMFTETKIDSGSDLHLNNVLVLDDIYIYMVISKEYSVVFDEEILCWGW